MLVSSGILLLLNLFVVVLVIEYLDKSLSDEVHFLHISLVTDNDSSWSKDSAQQVNDQLVCEASLTLLEEMVERLLEFLESSGTLDELSLHLWSQVLVKLELFDHQVEIIHESLLDILSDIVVQGWLNMVRFV